MAFLPVAESFAACRLSSISRTLKMHTDNPYDKQKFLSGRKDLHQRLFAAGGKPLSNLEKTTKGSQSFLPTNTQFPKAAKEPDHCTASADSQQDDLSLLLREASLFPKYDVGLVIEHKQHGYRGVVLASDRGCKASEEWVESFGVDGLDRGVNQPFYSVLVDTRDRGPSPQVTYVAEDNVRVSQRSDAVQHPLVLRLFAACSKRPPAPHYPPAVAFDLRYKPGEELEGVLEHLAQQRKAPV